MNKTEFVIYCIQHDDSFPNLGEIDLPAAERFLSITDPKEDIPQISAEEFMTKWNSLIHDASVMTE